MKRRLQALALLSVAGQAMPAVAQEAAQPAQVIVTASAPPSAPRREFVAGKIIIDRRRIEESGLRTVEELLKREPAVTVGPDGRIGLLNLPGYTQILIDGQPPQGGKTGELELVHVEKIEIIKSSVAEYGPFGIAGTINLVSRKTARKTSTMVAVGAGIDASHGTHLALSHQQSSANSPIRFNFALTADQGNGREQGRQRQTLSLPGHGEQQQWEAAVTGRSRTPMQAAEGSVTWQRRPDETITLAPSLWKIGGDSSASETRRFAGGSTTDVRENGRSALDLLRLPLTWSFKPDQASFVEVSLRSARTRLRTSSMRVESTAAQQATARDTARRQDGSVNSAGVVYKVKVAGGHDVKLGASVMRSRQDAQYAYRIDGETDSTLAALGPQRAYRGTERRLYVQDEWRLSDSVALNAGLSGTGLGIDTAEGPYRSQARFRLWAPSLHLSKKIGEGDANQLRVSLARSFSPPDDGRYTLRPVIHPLAPCTAQGVCVANTVATADSAGNISLQPERALGLNLAYEHSIGDDSQVTLELYTRRIDNKIGEQIMLEHVGWSSAARYVARPANLGQARATGIDVEMELALRDLVEDGPKVTMRGNVGVARSHVASLPGPDNRLDKQPPWSAKLGAAYHMQKWPLKFDISGNWRPAVWARTSHAESVGLARSFALDASMIWTVSKQRRLVVSVASRSPDTARKVNEYMADAGQLRLYTDSRKYQQLDIKFETTL